MPMTYWPLPGTELDPRYDERHWTEKRLLELQAAMGCTDARRRLGAINAPPTASPPAVAPVDR